MSETSTVRPDGWISVGDKLPKEGQDTWVYAVPPADVDAEPEVNMDSFEGNRGEKVKFTGPMGDGESISSGWYVYSGWDVTHWQPIIKPAPPEVSP